MQSRGIRSAGVLLGVLTGLVLIASPVGATMLGVNLDGLGLVPPPGSPTVTSNIVGGCPADPSGVGCDGTDTAHTAEVHGTLTTTAFQAGGLYTYLATVAPMTTGISIFTTSSGVAGLTGQAGWSFNDAANSGANAVFPGVNQSNIFSMSLDPVGNVTWNVNPLAGASCPPSCFWTTSDPSNPGYYLPITFFYQSTNAPGIGQLGLYSMTNQFTGYGEGLTPVAEPGSLLLLASGLTGLGLVLRRRSSGPSGADGE